MRVLIVPDKFKGTLRADEAARAIASGWKQTRPEDSLELLPMSDGGDGFGEIIGNLIGAKKQSARTINATHESIEVSWWWSEAEKTAVLESASVIGLAMLPAGLFHPFELDTLGLGQLLLQISKQHPGARLIVGIGGSATNDGGFGMARGLGYRFYDAQEYCIDRWVALGSLLHIKSPERRALFTQVIIATDVQNQLLGPQGASRVYGPQKGLRPEDFPAAEKSLERVTEVVRRDLGKDCAAEPGTGAAGGLGYGLRVFLDGTFEPGFDIFARLSNLEEKIRAADVVVTAEGAIDAQTEMGKGTGAIAKKAREHGKRCIGLAGYLPEGSNPAYDLALGIAPELTSIEEAKRNAAPWLEKLAGLAAGKISCVLLIGLAVLGGGCATESTNSTSANSATREVHRSSPAQRATTFLSSEVPAWEKNNHCYSCHNNGDGARALLAAKSAGYPVPTEALATTLAWLREPAQWDHNKGDRDASDAQLADIQFALALSAAIDSGEIRKESLTAAARRVARHQSADGSWDVEPQNAAGSPVTYGTPLATYFCWKIVSATDDPTLASSRQKAERWLSSRTPKNTPECVALLLHARDSGNPVRVREMIAYLARTKLSDGGWGPYPQTASEVFDTALVVWALARIPGTENLREPARGWLVRQQQADGGWAATTRPSGGESYAQGISTSAWATLALLSGG